MTFLEDINGVFSVANDPLASQLISAGDKIQNIPEITANAGYVFVGWQMNGAGEILNNEAIQNMMILEDVNYVAVYVLENAILHTLRFQEGTGSGAPDEIVLPKGTVVDLSLFTAIPPTGYTFIGWEDRMGMIINTVVLDEDTILTAKYVSTTPKGPFRVTYDGNGYDGGTLPGDGKEYFTGDTVTVLNSVSKANHTFGGWNDEIADVTYLPGMSFTMPDGSGTSYGANGSLTMPNYDVVLFAQWSAGENIVSYATSNASLNHDFEAVFTGSSPVNVPAVTADEGYTFQGQWVCSLGGTYTIAELLRYVVTGDVTFTTVIVPNAVQATDRILTFNANGGTNAPYSLTVSKGTVITLTGMTATAPEGKTFTGWATEAQGGNTITKVIMNDNEMIYAQYVDLPAEGYYVVHFSAGINGAFSVAGEALSNVPVLGSAPSYTAVYAPAEATFYTLSFDPGIGNTGTAGDVVLPEGMDTDVSLLIPEPTEDKASDVNENDAINNSFPDVSDKIWYAQAVNYLAEIGILQGYEDGAFRPDQGITRTEFAAIATRFDYLQKGVDLPFTDVPGELRTLYPDLPTSHWAFADMIEASVAHEYSVSYDGYGTWSQYNMK